ISIPLIDLLFCLTLSPPPSLYTLSLHDALPIYTAGPRSALVWDDSFLEYRFSDTHPMDPVRLKLTHRLAAALGVLDEQKLTQIQPPVATDAQLASVHSI